MELLTEILNGIDLIKKDPGSVDLSEVVRLLSLAHEVARDGLERSSNAALYLKLKPALEELRNSVPALESNVSNLESKLSTTAKELDAFKEFFSDTKQDVLGKIQLIKSYSKDYKKNLSSEIENSGIHTLLTLRSKILSDFNQEWSTDSKSTKLVTDLAFMDHKLYKTGA